MAEKIPSVGEIIRIESIKHDGKLHRAWEHSVVLEIGKGPLLAANRDVKVTEANGGQWISQGLAICQFHREEWFNTILLFQSENQYRYYCNIASPYRWRGRSLLYTDYDLDLIVDSELRFQWLDEEEFEENRRRMNYPTHVIRKVKQAADELESRIRQRCNPFTPEFVRACYHRYLYLKNQIRGEEREDEAN